ncbi:MAG TPA: HIT family protein [Candidatus Paceibacterota bacterium]|nr:HIT family protein [Candidatus Paceibacterota bacterium]
MKGCIFCKMIKGDIPAEKVFENDYVIAVMDIHPKAPGHVMVIPKVHASNILDLSDDEIKPLFLAVKKVADMIYNALDPQGFTMGLNHGSVSGQEVDHIHFHIITRFEGDGGGSLHGVVDNPPDEKISDIASKIRENE